MNIILLNGPPRAGKDTVADILSRTFSYEKKSFALPLKRAIASFFNKDLAWLEDNKDNPISNPTTYRDLLIGMSENVIKPKLGLTFFGKLLADEVSDSAAHNFVITDCGFTEEVHEFISQLCKQIREIQSLKLHLWRVTRPGCDFTNDSREFIEPLPLHPFLHIHNDWSLTSLYLRVVSLMRNIQ
jgi:hypothetical protein